MGTLGKQHIEADTRNFEQKVTVASAWGNALYKCAKPPHNRPAHPAPERNGRRDEARTRRIKTIIKGGRLGSTRAGWLAGSPDNPWWLFG